MAKDSCSTKPSSSIDGIRPFGLTARKAGDPVFSGASGASGRGSR